MMEGQRIILGATEEEMAGLTVRYEEKRNMNYSE